MRQYSALHYNDLSFTEFSNYNFLESRKGSFRLLCQIFDNEFLEGLIFATGYEWLGQFYEFKFLGK